MNATTVLDVVTVFFAGLLAGALFVIDYGVRAPLGGLEAQSQIQTRQALILRLRVLVPAIFVPTVLLGAAVILLNGNSAGFGFRVAALLLVLVSFLLTLFGTARINAVALTWQPSAPPSNWRLLVSRWERLDQLRTWAAVLGFALFVTAMAR
jgi:uncharacterized membrane protein